MITNFSDTSSILNTFVAELRDVEVQTNPMRFRRNLERIGEIMAYEISKTFRYEPMEVHTPLGTAEVELSQEQTVLATILRAGLPLHQGLLNVFDEAENAFVSAYRKHHKDGSFEIKLEYASCPDLNGKTLILADAMLATGSSVIKTLRVFQEYGRPRSVHIVSAIAAADGIEQVQRQFPDASIWTGAIDEELTAKSYIVPGLGDAGDLAFGEKLQD